jgi:regulator of nucleoside diphosphate kinase
MKNPIIQITKAVYQLLDDLVKQKRNLSAFNRAKLQAELTAAQVLEESDLAPDTIRLNSHIEIQDIATKKTMNAQLVMPAGADIRKNRISFLAPIGLALIGYRQGAIVDWEMPGGRKKYRVISVRN